MLSLLIWLEIIYKERYSKLIAILKVSMKFLLKYFIKYIILKIDKKLPRLKTERVTEIPVNNKFYCANCGKEMKVKLPLDNWLGVYKLKHKTTLGVFYCWGCNFYESGEHKIKIEKQVDKRNLDRIKEEIKNVIFRHRNNRVKA